MDVKPASGYRVHFLVTGTTTPQPLVGAGQRQAVVFVNENSGVGIRIGHSGTVASRGLFIPPSQSFADNYTVDDWWVVGAGTGTLVSGFIVIGQ